MPEAEAHQAGDTEAQQQSRAERTIELSDEVLKSLESGQRAALEAIRKFADTVDEMLPTFGERPSKREEFVDAAMAMTERLVHIQYDFLRNVLHGAGDALRNPGDVK